MNNATSIAMAHKNMQRKHKTNWDKSKWIENGISHVTQIYEQPNWDKPLHSILDHPNILSISMDFQRKFTYSILVYILRQNRTISANAFKILQIFWNRWPFSENIHLIYDRKSSNIHKMRIHLIATHFAITNIPILIEINQIVCTLSHFQAQN